MTVSTTATRVIYAPGGAETDFAVPFVFVAGADLEVIRRDIATGAEAMLRPGTDYTVTGGGGGTGTVTATVAPPAGVQWVIRRVTPLTQDIDYVENDPFPAATHERGLDLAVMRAQEARAELDRVPRLPVSDPDAAIGNLPSSVARAGRVAAFDADGKPTVSTLTLAAIEGGATDAAASATAAAGSAASAEAAATNAAGSEGDAAASAAAAAASAAALNLPVIGAGDAGRGLTVTADGTGYEMTAAAFGTAAFAAVAVLAPPGLVAPYAGPAAPMGWLLCDGRAVSRTGHADLFAAIGETYGPGDGTTTFNVPDLRGRVTAGKDDMGGTVAGRLAVQVPGVPDGTVLGGTGGEAAHTQTVDEMPSHSHNYDQIDTGVAGLAGSNQFWYNGDNDAVTTDTGGGDPFNIVQPTIILNYIIKT